MSHKPERPTGAPLWKTDIAHGRPTPRQDNLLRRSGILITRPRQTPLTALSSSRDDNKRKNVAGAGYLFEKAN